MSDLQNQQLIFSSKRSKSWGFTIIEMTVVIFILVTITAIVVANYKGGQGDINLTRSAQKLALDLRRAQNNAISGATLSGTAPYGYGLYFNQNDATTYIIFADLNNDQLWSSTEDALVETIALKNDVTINSLSPASPLHVYFLSPEPTIYINGAASGNAVIELKNKFDKIKTIRINTAGRIDVQ